MTNLRKGRIENPGYEKMRAIARAMGFPPEAWFEDAPGDVPRPASVEGRDLSARIAHLFEAVVHPRTGESYTNTEVARMSAGVLTEEEVEGMRTGAIADPTVGQVAALAAVFGVEPSYLVDRKEPPQKISYFLPVGKAIEAHFVIKGLNEMGLTVTPVA